VYQHRQFSEISDYSCSNSICVLAGDAAFGAATLATSAPNRSQIRELRPVLESALNVSPLFQQALRWLIHSQATML
jgi:hypothetical protein